MNTNNIKVTIIMMIVIKFRVQVVFISYLLKQKLYINIDKDYILKKF